MYMYSVWLPIDCRIQYMFALNIGEYSECLHLFDSANTIQTSRQHISGFSAKFMRKKGAIFSKPPRVTLPNEVPSKISLFSGLYRFVRMTKIW